MSLHCFVPFVFFVAKLRLELTTIFYVERVVFANFYLTNWLFFFKS